MRHQLDHRKLGRTSSHRRALLRNMVTSLILSERIETTLPKAKELRRVADNMITLGKKGDLHARRQASSYLMTPLSVTKLFDVLAQRFKDRQGGYTRVYRFGSRPGDGADMAAIEYLGYQLPVKTTPEEKKTQEKKAKKAKAEAKSKTEKVAKPEKKLKAKKSETNKDIKKETKADQKGLKGLFSRKKKED